ncbi:hypothetical protein [Geodermatophilus sp. TF02-6]|uniref:hypothetical protein n=1 Tax=Geodermatophilus sp. TF02-6 TaxID=2250575 RepID=UPI0011BF9C3F|nr:hypothetical protein [Geodermatophilus sp. TF02-6]
MVLAASLFVLLGLGLFVAGFTTETTAFYWACVVSCALAAVLLLLARVRTAREDPSLARPAPDSEHAPGAEPRVVTGSRAGPESRPVIEPQVARRPAGRAAQDSPPAGGPAGHSPAGRHAAAADGLEPTATDPGRTVPPRGASAYRPSTESREVPPLPRRPGAHEARNPAAPDPDSADGARSDRGEPAEEEVEVTDLLLVVDLVDDVVVVDEHPRYHLAGCPYLAGRTSVLLPMTEARADGFSPCAVCRPVRHLADTERSRRAARGS